MNDSRIDNSEKKYPFAFKNKLEILAIGSHIDDIWYGCSATLMRLQEEYEANVTYIDLCDSYPHKYRDSVEITSDTHSRIKQLCEELDFRYVDKKDADKKDVIDRAFPECLGALSERIKEIGKKYSNIDLVFIPRRDDFHQDHVLTAMEVLKWFRHCTILEYEIKEFRRGSFHPNLLFDVNRPSKRMLRGRGSMSFAEKKVFILDEIFYPSILGMGPPSKPPSDIFRSQILGRLAVRAKEFGLDASYAEAFTTDIIVR